MVAAGPPVLREDRRPAKPCRAQDVGLVGHDVRAERVVGTIGALAPARVAVAAQDPGELQLDGFRALNRTQPLIALNTANNSVRPSPWAGTELRRRVSTLVFVLSGVRNASAPPALSGVVEPPRRR